MTILWTTAFITGLLGSLHCVGMCGPIALALPIGGMNASKIVFSRIIYNFGRIVTYSFIGFLMGFIGEKVFFSGLQQQISIVGGVLILLIVVFRKVLIIKSLHKYANQIKQYFSYFFRQKTLLSMFFLGMLNGLLPCGFLYLAAVGSIVSGNAIGGMIYMALFGLGTAPVMFAISIIAKTMGQRFRKFFHKLSPIYTLFLAIFLIIRGLNLGIANISPKFIGYNKTAESAQKIVVCHAKKNLKLEKNKK